MTAPYIPGPFLTRFLRKLAEARARNDALMRQQQEAQSAALRQEVKRLAGPQTHMDAPLRYEDVVRLRGRPARRTHEPASEVDQMLMRQPSQLQEELARRKQRSADTVDAVKQMLKGKLAPRSADEAMQALDAIFSFDRKRLEAAPGTIIPELMISLSVVPGALQALRDVIMDIKGDDVSWYTALAAAGALPLITPAMRTMRSVEKATRIAEETIRAREGGEEILRLIHRTKADLAASDMITDPRMAGTGHYPGAERKAGKGAAGTFFTKEGGYVEHAFRDLPEYTTEVPAKYIYDLDADPEGLFKNTRTRRGMKNKVMKAGYLGWKSEDNVVEIFYPMQLSARRHMLSNADNLAEFVINESMANKAGGTFDLGKMRRIPKEQEAYVASHTGHSLTQPLDNIDPVAVREWVNANMAKLRENPKLQIGWWVDEKTGEMVYDLSEDFGTHEKMIEAMRPGGVSYGEQGGWDNLRQEFVPNPHKPPRSQQAEMFPDEVTTRGGYIDPQDAETAAEAIRQHRRNKFMREFPVAARRAKGDMRKIDAMMRNFEDFLGTTPSSIPDDAVYHGSGNRFDVFSQTSDIGYHFGTEGAARRRLNDKRGRFRQRGDKPGMLGKYYLRTENPMYLRDLGNWAPYALADAIENKLRASGEFTGKARLYDVMRTAVRYDPGERTGNLDKDLYAWLQKYLKSHGYDSIAYVNQGEPTIGGRAVQLRSGETVADIYRNLDLSYIVFDPEQIKSTRNVGTFLRDNPNVHLGLAAAAGLGAAAMGDNEEGTDAASLILLAGTGGQIDPRALRIASRTGREAQALAKDVEAAGGVVMESRRLRADQLRKYLTADEAELLQRKGQMKRFERAAKRLMAPEELINISLAGQGNRGGYQRTAQWFADNFGEDAPVAIGLFAAMSPRTGVAENTEMALDAFDTWVRLGRPRTAEGAAKVTRSVKGMQKTFGPNVERVLTAESLDDLYSVLSGPKVQSFGPNLTGDPSRVTNDTWMAVLHNIDPKYFGSALTEAGTGRGLAGGDYLAANALTRAAGERFPGGAVPGREMQEMGWAGVKGLVEGTGPAVAEKGVAIPGRTPLRERVHLIPGADYARAEWNIPRIAEEGILRRGLLGELRGPAVGAPAAEWPTLIPLQADPYALRGTADRITRGLLRQYPY